MEGWTNVTNAVHVAGDNIFLQLWYVGRSRWALPLHGNATDVSPSIPTPQLTPVQPSRKKLIEVLGVAIAVNADAALVYSARTIDAFTAKTADKLEV